MKPEDFYKEEFAKDYELVKDLKEQPFFNFRSMMEFAEMYHTKQCAINDVVGRIEQLLCSCDNLNGFKEMEEGRETCSKCKKPY